MREPYVTDRFDMCILHYVAIIDKDTLRYQTVKKKGIIVPVCRWNILTCTSIVTMHTVKCEAECHF